MEIKIDNQEKEYIFKAKKLEVEIAQNIENIVTRVKYNVPLARHKGIIVENIDQPQELVKINITADILEELDREEERFNTSQIDVSTENSDGKLLACIKGGIDE